MGSSQWQRAKRDHEGTPGGTVKGHQETFLKEGLLLYVHSSGGETIVYEPQIHQAMPLGWVTFTA